MSRGVVNRLVQGVMIAALGVTGWPLVQPLLPQRLEARADADWGKAHVDAARVVVDAKDSLTAEQLQGLNSRYGLSLRLNSVQADDEELLISDVPADRQLAVLKSLRADPLVEAAEPSYQFTSLWKPNDPRYKEQWNLAMIGAEKAWDKRANGKGVVVAVIDTGVAFEDDARCYKARDFGGTAFTKGYDFVNDDEHPFDDNGHGTHVAGTIAESTDNGEGVAGLAFGASIMPLKVLDGFGSGNSSDIADAIRYAADNGAKVINMSLGSPYPDRVMQLACQYAVKKGVLIVCAAGNSGGSVGYPAGFPECMAVSAVGPSGELARYSSRGREVAIAAPGGDLSAGPSGGILQNTLLDGERASDNYYGFQGTSMASPHVAAAAALIMGQGVKDPAKVRQMLQDSASPKKPAVNYGAGILNVGKGVGAAAADQSAPLALILITFAAGVMMLMVGLKSKAGLWSASGVFSGFLMGFFGPHILYTWLGFGTPLGIVLHSSVVPLYLLWEAESRTFYRFVGAVAVATAVRLALDAAQGHAAFLVAQPGLATPWLWVNVAVALGVAIVAYRRSHA